MRGGPSDCRLIKTQIAPRRLSKGQLTPGCFVMVFVVFVNGAVRRQWRRLCKGLLSDAAEKEAAFRKAASL